MDLAGEDHRIDHRAAVVNDDIFQYLQFEDLRIDLDDHRVDAVGGGARGRTKILRRLQARFDAGFDRAAHRIGALGELAEPNEFFGNAGDRYLAVGQHQIVFGAFERIARQLQGLLPHDARGFIDGVAGHHRTTAGKGSGAPIELVGIPGDDVDLGDVDAELVGHDLRKAGEMPLPLRADPCGNADLAVGLHLDLCAFIRPDAGAFDITGETDADVAALRAQPW